MKRLVLFLAASALAVGSTLVPGLEAILARSGPGDAVAVVVQPRLPAVPDRLPPGAGYDQRLGRLRSAADSARRDILAWLATTEATDVRPFLLAGRIALAAPPGVIRALAARPDVAYVYDDFAVALDPVRAGPAAEPDRLQRWNIGIIRAPECWAAGYDGTGVVVANITTGVAAGHEALAGRWRATDGWFDAVNGRTDPYDDNGHGTHTLGSAVGGNGIGVAPGATYIAAKAINSGGAGQASWILACLDWLAEHGRPDVLLNAWTAAARTDGFWFAAYAWLHYLGILVPATTGSSGPGPSTSLPPGSYPVCIGVGATDSADAVAPFSARGPAPDQAPWNEVEYWPRPDWDLINPGLSAPGVNILSARHTGGYITMSGTAMAAAHVAGAAALLRQKDPDLTPDEAFNLLADCAARPEQGAPYPNHNYGWGRLDAKAALDTIQLGIAGPERPARQPGTLSVRPSPGTAPVRLGWDMPEAGPVRVLVCDAAGRVVAQPVDGFRPAGPQNAIWNGRADDGTRCAPGSYFLRVEAPTGARLSRFILVR